MVSGRGILHCLLLCISLCNAANYYFDSVGGDDTRTPTQAQTMTTPWKSIAKFNLIQSTLLPGDQALFLRGRKWNDQLRITVSGNATSPIIVGSYGATTDPLPVFSGAITVPTTGWLKTGSIYSTNITFPPGISAASVENVFIDGTKMIYARAPNSGWYRITAGASGTTMTDSNRNEASGYWTGATVRIRTSHYLYDVEQVTNFANGVFSLGSSLNANVPSGYGYFLEGKSQLLDAPSEWFFSGSTLSLMTADGSNPSTHTVEVVVWNSSIVVSGSASYITISNIRVEKNADTNIILADGPNTAIKIIGCQCAYADTGIFFHTGIGSIVQDSSVSFQTQSGIQLGVASRNTSAVNNVISDISLTPGYAVNSAGIIPGQFADYCSIINNLVNRTGYAGIHFGGPHVRVEGNIVDNPMLALSDGGGLYAWGDFTFGSVLVNNIVTNVYGNVDGMLLTDTPLANAIYIDDRLHDIEIFNNTAAFCQDAALFIHNDWNLNIHGNNLMGCQCQVSMAVNLPGDRLYNNSIHDNVLFTTSRGQNLICETYNTEISANFRGNSYCDPFDYSGFQSAGNYFSFDEWMNQTGNIDVGSTMCNIRAQDYKVSSYLGDNIVKLNSFSCWPNDCSTTFLNHSSTCLYGTCLQYHLATTSPNDQTQAQSNTFVANFTQYELTFDGYATTSRDVNIIVRLQGAPYANTLTSTHDIFVPTSGHYAMVFDRIANFSGVSALNFQMPVSDGGNIFIGNISFRPVTYVPSSPVVVYANPTNAVANIGLPNGEAFLTFDGKLIYNSVTLGPYRSIILIDRGFQANLTQSSSIPKTTLSGTSSNSIIGSGSDMESSSSLLMMSILVFGFMCLLM